VGNLRELWVEAIPGNYLAFYKNVYDVIKEGVGRQAEQSRDVIRIEACMESNCIESLSKYGAL
jgi:hypothetical protein